jgi:hypothetical protein
MLECTVVNVNEIYFCILIRYMCANGIDSVSIFTIFQLYFETVLTVWIFCFAIHFIISLVPSEH